MLTKARVAVFYRLWKPGDSELGDSTERGSVKYDENGYPELIACEQGPAVDFGVTVAFFASHAQAGELGLDVWIGEGQTLYFDSCRPDDGEVYAFWARIQCTPEAFKRLCSHLGAACAFQRGITRRAP